MTNILEMKNRKVVNSAILGFKKTLDYLYDGEPKTAFPLLWVCNTYKEWPAMLNWLVKNEMRGKKLVEFFGNESPDGGGFHSGATLILSRIKGHKYHLKNIKADELT